MARSPSDHGGCIFTGGASIAALLLTLTPQDVAAAAPGGTFDFRQGSNVEINVRDDTMAVQDVVITHGPGTRVEAKSALQTSRPGNVKQLDLSGGVKIDYNGATLAADSAVMQYRGDQLLSVQVQGQPARFSHQPPGLQRLSGSAGSINLDVPTGRLVLSGDTSYTDGCNRLTSSRITYHMNEGRITDAGHPETSGRAVLCLDGDDGSLDIDRYANLVIDVRRDTVEAQDVQISHGGDMRVAAQSARQTRAAGNVKQLELTGDVKMDFNEATLDASRAMVAFNGDQLVSAEVTGDRVEFSHQPGDFRRVFGEAGAIRFETATGKLVFSGNPTFTDGCFEMTDPGQIFYDIHTGVATDDGDPSTRGGLTMCADPGQRRVLTPRAPLRGTAL